MTAILGISAFYHDAAAALVVDGRIVAAAQEERFSRTKHDERFPLQAIEYCLDHAGISPADLDYVGFYDKPFLKFERLLETYLAFAPVGFPSFLKAMPVWLRQKLHLRRALNRGLGGQFRKRYVFTEHHEAHAASAFFPSPFDEAAILTVDGVGEWATASFGTGQGNRLHLSHELHFPHSPGLLYSAFTYFCGFRVNSGEYKLMGLAPYGHPRYVDPILTHLIDLKGDGSFRMDQSYFRYGHGLTMTSPKFHRLFGGPPRRPESPISEREMDLAASIQVVIEEIMLRMARHVRQRTGMPRLCLAGGVALNCVANGRILREGVFDDLWIQPAAGDAGGSLGVAMFIWHQLLGHPRKAEPQDAQQGSLLGPAYSERQIRDYLDQRSAAYRWCESDQEMCERVASLLADGRVVGWFQGRMEFGPRALGARSILADARRPEMQSVMNQKIKFRESFRPFAPAVLEERASEFFDLSPSASSPYMLLVERLRKEQRCPLNAREAALSGLAQLEVIRSRVPAVTHIDWSARLQTVDASRHGLFHQLLREFEKQTGCPLLVNTSFNVRGEPIVCNPEDAYRSFMTTHMDALAMGRAVLIKQAQPTDCQTAGPHRPQFAAD